MKDESRYHASLRFLAECQDALCQIHAYDDESRYLVLDYREQIAYQTDTLAEVDRHPGVHIFKVFPVAKRPSPKEET